MNNECGAKYFDATGLLHICELVRNHEGAHYDYRFRRTWPRNHPSHGHYANYSHVVDEEVAAVKKQTVDMKQGFCPVRFTLHELAELYVILSGNHDIPEVYLNKVAAALKEAL